MWDRSAGDALKVIPGGVKTERPQRSEDERSPVPYGNAIALRPIRSPLAL